MKKSYIAYEIDKEYKLRKLYKCKKCEHFDELTNKCKIDKCINKDINNAR